MAVKRIVRNCLISYAKVLEPGITPQGDQRYSAQLLIDKTDTELVQNLKEAIKQARIEKFGKKPAKKQPLRDGDAENAELEEQGSTARPEHVGKYFMNVSSKNAPKVVGRDPRQAITDPEQVYSGCLCNVSVAFYGFDVDGNKGVAAGLNNIQVVDATLPRLDGRTSPEDDFEALDPVESDEEFEVI